MLGLRQISHSICLYYTTVYSTGHGREAEWGLPILLGDILYV